MTGWRMVHSERISVDRYGEYCRSCDISPAYHHEIVDYYFSRLRADPHFVARFDEDGQFLAAYPVLWEQVFPNSLHKRIYGRHFAVVGDIGQPEALFPDSPVAARVPLHYLSPVTSPLLRGHVRGLRSYSLKEMAIAKRTGHHRDTRKLKAWRQAGGTVHVGDDVPPAEFADIYVRLHCARWGYSAEDFQGTKEQIIALHRHVFRVVLFENGDPVAAHFCLKNEGPSIYYIDSINIGVRPHAHGDVCYGSLLLLASLRHAEATAEALGKTLRYSYGYYRGPGDYKTRWAEPEKSFVAC